MSKPCNHTLSFGEGTQASPDRCVNCGALFERAAHTPFGYANLLQQSVRPKKNETLVYTAGGGHQFTCVVLVVHRTSGAKIRVQFPIRDGSELLGCFQGDVFEVTDSHLSFRSREGVTVSNLRQKAA